MGSQLLLPGSCGTCCVPAVSTWQISQSHKSQPTVQVCSQKYELHHSQSTICGTTCRLLCSIRTMLKVALSSSRRAKSPTQCSYHNNSGFASARHMPFECRTHMCDMSSCSTDHQHVHQPGSCCLRMKALLKTSTSQTSVVPAAKTVQNQGHSTVTLRKQTCLAPLTHCAQHLQIGALIFV
jgi:hypothetical protein